MGEDTRDLLALIDGATSRLVADLATLSDDDARAPSRLPGWSRGHLLTHLARNADALGNLLGWARTGVERRAYASVEHRAGDIEAGSGRSAAELRADVAAAAGRWAVAAAALSPTDWQAPVVVRAVDPPLPAAQVALARLEEVEVHHIDLGLSYSFADIPGDALAWLLGYAVEVLNTRPGRPAFTAVAADRDQGWTVGAGGAGAPRVAGDAADLLAWLTGRGSGERLTVTGATELPRLPAWS